MNDGKSKDYDFDADDPFMDNPLEKSAGANGSDGSGSSKQEQDLDEDLFDTSELDLDLDPSSNKNNKAQPDLGSENLGAKKSALGNLGLMDLLKEYYLYLIGAVVVLAIIYYMYGMIFGSNTPSNIPQAPVQQQQQQGFGLSTQPVKIASKNTQTAQNQAAQQFQGPPTISFTQDDLKQMIEGFTGVVNRSNGQLAAQLGQIADAQAKLIQQETTITNTQAKDLSELSTQVQNLNTALAQSNQNMTNISETLLRTQSQLKLLLAEKAQTRDQLVLRAVVPGRAWLVDAAGKTLSVAVGDEISDYGKVEQIDDKTATVIMSSGYVFN